MAPRTFDFLVIGAARCGTTSLWRALDSHPGIQVPSDKEREFFSSNERYERGLDHYIARTFDVDAEGQALGTLTPQLMAPEPQALRTIIRRIQETCPDVRLMAMLRDPIERGISQFRRMKKVSGGEAEDFDAFIERQAERRDGLDQVPLIRASDYGRILRRYFKAFDRSQLEVFFTEELDTGPRDFYKRVFTYLGVEPDHDPGEPRVHVGGIEQRVGPEALKELMVELDRREMFPEDDENARRGFAWWLRHLWNCEPDKRGTDISSELRGQLAERYLADAELLAELIGREPPWVDSLRAAV